MEKCHAGAICLLKKDKRNTWRVEVFAYRQAVEQWPVHLERWASFNVWLHFLVNPWCNREFYIPLSRQTESLSLTVLFHLAGCSSGHKPKRVLRLERRLRIKYTMLQQHWVILCLTSEWKSRRDELSMCMCGSGNLMNQSLLHQSWSKWGSRCSFPFLSYLLFLFFPCFFPCCRPSPQAVPHTADKSLWHAWHSAEQ